jgi:hypothetical protein
LKHTDVSDLVTNAHLDFESNLPGGSPNDLSTVLVIDSTLEPGDYNNSAGILDRASVECHQGTVAIMIRDRYGSEIK